MSKTVALLCSLLVITAMVPPDYLRAGDDPVSLANQLGNQAIGAFGTQSGVNQRLFSPVMSNTVSMTTLDETKSFTAQLMCPGSSKFLEIFVQPSGTGDLTSVIVSQDTNMDDATDYTFAIPFAISGVCSNGVISCSPGTWNNCQTYRWAADETGKVSLQVTQLTNLGGCYCINSSCGSNLVWNNLGIVLKSLGSGAAAAVHQGNARFVISDVKIDGTLATYYGQDSRSCTTASGGTGTEAYYYNPDALSGAVGSLTVNQATDPSSMYNLLSLASQNRNAEIKTCSIMKSATLKWSPAYDCSLNDYTDDQCTAVQNDPNCELRQESVDGVFTFNNFSGTGLTPQPSCINLTEQKSASCEYVCPGAENLNIPCSLYSEGGTPQCNVNGTLTNCVIMNPIKSIGGMPQGAPNEAIVRGWLVTFQDGIVAAGSSGAGAAYCSGYTIFQPETCNDILPGATACFNFGSGKIGLIGVKASYPADCDNWTCNAGGAATRNVYTITGSDLRLDSTCVSGGNSANVTARILFSPDLCPIANGASACIGTPSFCNKTCTQQVCKDWWRKTRTYVCRTTGYDFSIERKRAETIKRSVADNSTSIYYRDYRLGDYEDHTINSTGVMRGDAAKTCEKACKTRKPTTMTETNVTLTKANYHTNSQAYEFYYKACISNVCPLTEGEELVKDCQCINEFADASVIMQTLRLGGQDLICSSGTKSALH